MMKYTRNKTIDIDSPASKLLKLLQDDPIQFLKLLGLTVKETLIDYKPGSNSSGEWLVTEKMSIPLTPSIHFRTKFTRLENGSQWESWEPLGIYVDSSLTVNTKVKDQELTDCQAVEVAVVSCPFYIYPYVRWQTNKNLITIKQFIEKDSIQSI